MKTQFAWHVHHDKLIEPLIGSIEERIAYIEDHKPEKERDLRLRLLKPVIGPLPIIYVEAGKACDKAREAYDEAEEVYGRGARKALVEAGKACDKAREAYVEAEEVYVKAREACVEAIKVSQPIIEQLHSTECQNCPWDGQTIFPPATKGNG